MSVVISVHFHLLTANNFTLVFSNDDYRDVRIEVLFLLLVLLINDRSQVELVKGFIEGFFLTEKNDVCFFTLEFCSRLFLDKNQI